MERNATMWNPRIGLVMPLIIGGVAAMVALAAGILGQVDAIASLGRALLAFVLGWIGGQVWYAMFTVQGQSSGVHETGQTAVEAEE
jgi:hypothetical protein